MDIFIQNYLEKSTKKLKFPQPKCIMYNKYYLCCIRNFMQYSSNFESDLQFGQKYEKIVADALLGNNVEVKTEKKWWKKTGNHYVETKSRGKASGIMKTDAKFWCIVLVENNEDINKIIIIPVERIKAMIKSGKYPKKTGGDNDTSEGYLIKIRDL